MCGMLAPCRRRRSRVVGWTPTCGRACTVSRGSAGPLICSDQKDVGLLGQPAADEEIERSYVLRITRQRVHQRKLRDIVFKHYGPRRDYCGLDMVEVLGAAHIQADSQGGAASVATAGPCAPTIIPPSTQGSWSGAQRAFALLGVSPRFHLCLGRTGWWPTPSAPPAHARSMPTVPLRDPRHTRSPYDRQGLSDAGRWEMASAGRGRSHRVAQ